MVGILIKNAAAKEMEEFKEIYFKLKIYACDDLESILDEDDYDDYDDHKNDYAGNWLVYISCNTERIQKCSRLIFVWTYGGRGIDFLYGHGIHFNVSF